MFCVFVCSSSYAFCVSGRVSSNVGQFEAPCSVLTTLASSSCESRQLTFLRLHCLWWGSYLLCNSTLLLALRCVSLLCSGGLLEWCFLYFCEDFQQSVAIWSSLLCRDATGEFLLCIASIDVLALSWRHWRVLIMYRVDWCPCSVVTPLPSSYYVSRQLTSLGLLCVWSGSYPRRAPEGGFWNFRADSWFWYDFD
jgi:hypothetical protein